MKLYRALAGMDSLKFSTIRRNSWPANENIIIDSNAQKFKRNDGPAGAYRIYRLSQDDYFATDWRGDITNPGPGISTMSVEQLMKASSNRNSAASIAGNRDILILPFNINGTRTDFRFTVAGNILTRI